MAATLGRRPNLSIETNQGTNDSGSSSHGGAVEQLLSPAVAGAFNAVTNRLLGSRPKIVPNPVKKNHIWTNTAPKESYEDFDSLEGGSAREVLTEEVLSPANADLKWTNCYVERVNKTQYRLYSDADERFLLSAKQVDDVFYISQYSTFADGTSEHPTSGYCAVLRKVEDCPQFKLFSTGCEFCDGKYYTCGHTGNDGTFVGCDRQLLADITQLTKRIPYVDADMRCLTVFIPMVMPDKRTRVVWCPRSLRTDSPTVGTPKRGSYNLSTPTSTPRGGRKKFFESNSGLNLLSPRTGAKDQSPNLYAPENNVRGPRSTQMNGDDDGQEEEIPAEGEQNDKAEGETRETVQLEQDRVELRSKLPEWNPELKSLVLKFNGGRVLAASSKNFMLAASADMSRGIMQFGKSRKGKFVLDYKHPIAPIQAFGIALAACHWCVGN